MFVLIANAAGYERYVRATGATLDENTGLLRLSTADYDNLEDMTFTIGGVDYTFTANAQIWPRVVSGCESVRCWVRVLNQCLPSVIAEHGHRGTDGRYLPGHGRLRNAVWQGNRLHRRDGIP